MQGYDTFEDGLNHEKSFTEIELKREWMREGKDEREVVRAALRKHSLRPELGSVVCPRLPSSLRTESQFDEILKTEEKKFKACLSIQLQRE